MLTLSTPFFRRAKPAKAQGCMTYGDDSASRSRTGLLLKKQLWIWPIIAVIVLAGVGNGINGAIERTMKTSLRSQLSTLLNVQRSMVETWLHIQESNASSLANDPQVREVAAQLVAATQPAAPSARSKASESAPPSVQSLSTLQAQLTQEL